MHYNDEQFQALTPFADEFRRAIQSNYCKHVRTDELETIRQAYMTATGTRYYPASYGCTYCVIQLMKDAGRLYLEDAEERAAAELAAANDTAAVQATLEDSAAKTETAPTEAVTPANSAVKPADGETPDQPAKAAKTAPKSKTTKTAKK